MRYGLVSMMLAGGSALSAGAAMAQTPVPPNEAAEVREVPATAPQVGQTGAGDGGLQEIVVTAQRREESLQRVPVAVTAFGTAQLENLRVTNVRNLAGLAPSLQINGQGNQNNQVITIRGVASGVSANSVDPKVGIYVDGVYIGRSTGSVFDLADIERVEVLRGPQGTLFGRNATSGAISLTTAAPTGEFGIRAVGSYGNYDAIRGKISVNLPEIGPFSVRVAYLHDEIEGDYRNLLAGKGLDFRLRTPEFGFIPYAKTLGYRNTDGVQVAVRGDFDAVTADYRFDYTDFRSSGRPTQAVGVIPSGITNGVRTAGGAPLANAILALQPLTGGITNLSPGARIRGAVANGSSNEHVVTQGHSLTLTAQVSDQLTVKSISSYRKLKQDPYIFDLGSSGGLRFSAAQLGALLTGNVAGLTAPANQPGPNDSFFLLASARQVRQQQFTQEVQFQLTTDLVQLTAGLFYFHEKAPAVDSLGQFQPIVNGVVLPTPFDAVFGNGNTRTTSYADSMAGYAQATFHLSDTIDLTGGARYTIDDRDYRIFSISGGQGGSLGPGTYKVSFEKATFTGILTWRPNDDVTAYGKIASGYVAGGIASGIPFRPEKLLTYEVGLKTQAFNNRLRANLAAYYSKYDDLQTQGFSNGRQTFDNAGKASIKGFEVEIDAVPVRGLTLSGNVGYTDFNYKTFVLSGLDVADEASTTYASKWTARLSGQYDAPEFESGAHLFGRVDGRYKSKAPQVTTPFRLVSGALAPLEAFRFTEAFWIVDGRVGLANLDLGGVKTQLSVFGQNLFDKHINQFGAPVVLFATSYERGRTYGVELGIAF